MPFKLKSKGELFGYNEELSTYNNPVFEKNLEDGILAEANRDGTIFIDKSLKGKAKQEAVDHEKIHIDQMNQGRLGYDDNIVTWKKDTRSPSRVYIRDKGNLIAMDGKEKGPEGAEFEWEKEAWDSKNHKA